MRRRKERREGKLRHSRPRPLPNLHLVLVEHPQNHPPWAPGSNRSQMYSSPHKSQNTVLRLPDGDTLSLAPWAQFDGRGPGRPKTGLSGFKFKA